MSLIKRINELEELEVPSNLQSLPPLAAIAALAPIIKAVLGIVKIFTGNKADDKIDEVIKWLDMVSIVGRLAENEKPKDDQPIA